MPAPKPSKRIANLSQGLLYTLVFIAILSAINFLGDRYNKSLDTTANKRYSLSEQSAKIARDLKEPMTITYWDRPDKFENARGLLDRYANLAPTLTVNYEDVDKSKTKAIAAGITQYGTITVQVGNKREQAQNLTEEDITGAMVRALKGGDRTVCFDVGAGESDPDDTAQAGYVNVKALTEKNNYKTKIIKLLEKAEIPMDCTIVVEGGPKRDLIPPVVAALKGFVENGGRAMFLMDPPLKIGGGIDENQALVDVLGGWGVKLDKDLVLDTSGIGQVFGLGPEAPLVTTYDTHAIVTPMHNIPTLFPIPRSMEINDTDKTKVSKLFSTSDDSRATKNLASSEIALSNADSKGPFTLGAAGTYATGKPNTTGRFVVVGTSRWIANGYLNFNGNRDLYMNMINWLSSDEDLISIRPKEPEDRPLNMNARQVSLFGWGSVLGVPLLIILAGFSVWWNRR